MLSLLVQSKGTADLNLTELLSLLVPSKGTANLKQSELLLLLVLSTVDHSTVLVPLALPTVTTVMFDVIYNLRSYGWLYVTVGQV